LLQDHIAAFLPHQWGSDIMVKVTPEVVDQVVDISRYAQVIALVKENQLLTALGLFILWQTGAP